MKARRAEVILSVRWRKMAKAEGIRVDESTPGTQVVRGSAVVVIDHFRVEADEVTVKWQAEAHNDLLVCAWEVTRFRQVRGQPYETNDVAMVTMANDQVTFLR